jgi:hypothetical protein
MNGTIDLVSLALAFAVVMAALSLIVSSLVRLLHYLFASRGRNLLEMLARLDQTYRSEHGEPAAAGDAPSYAFARDVLTFPVLHSSRPGQQVDGATRGRRQRERMAVRVEFMPLETLLQIVRTLCPDGRLRPSWHLGLSPDAQRVEDFERFARTWYGSLEGVATDRFRIRSRRAVAAVSALVVVAFNIDGFALLGDLRRESLLRQYLEGHAAEVGRLAQSQRDDLSDVHADGAQPNDLPRLLKLNGILNEPMLNLGWQRNYFSRRWCVYHGCTITEPALKVPVPNGFELAWDGVRWVLGLLFSCAMLSLGAPFWADFLARALKVRTALGPVGGYREQAERSRAPGSPPSNPSA